MAGKRFNNTDIPHCHVTCSVALNVASLFAQSCMKVLISPERKRVYKEGIKADRNRLYLLGRSTEIVP